MSAETEIAAVIDGLIDDAIEILVERTRLTRTALHDTYDSAAFTYLTADLDHSGRVTLDARSLANLLVPPAPEPAVLYRAAEERRQERKPVGWLEPEAFERSIARARAALENSNPADGGAA